MLVNMFNVFVCLFLQVTSFRCCVFCLWYYGSHVSSSACAGSGDAGKRDKERTRRWRRASTTSAGHYWALARLTKTTQTRCRRTRTCFTLWIGLETEPSERREEEEGDEETDRGLVLHKCSSLAYTKGDAVYTIHTTAQNQPNRTHYSSKDNRCKNNVNKSLSEHTKDHYVWKKQTNWKSIFLLSELKASGLVRLMFFILFSSLGSQMKRGFVSQKCSKWDIQIMVFKSFSFVYTCTHFP